MRFSIQVTRADGALDDYAFQGGRQRYLLIDGGVVRKAAELDWDGQLLSALEALHRSQPDPRCLEYLSHRLTRFLDDLDWDPTRAALSQAARRGDPTLLTLRFSAAELYALPWELVQLSSSGEQLGQVDRCVIEYEWPGMATAPLRGAPTQPARLLYLWADAGGSVPYEQHEATLKRHASAGLVSGPEVLARGSYRALGRALDRAEREGRPFSALHLLCHGRGAQGAFGLVLNDPDHAEGTVVLPQRLQQLLVRHAGSLRQVVISACHGARMDPLGSRLGGVAQALHRGGIETVLASRLPLTHRGSASLTEALYGGGFCQPERVEAAFMQARRELSYDARSLDYLAIQLYRRARDVRSGWDARDAPRLVAPEAPVQQRQVAGPPSEPLELAPLRAEPPAPKPASAPPAPPPQPSPSPRAPVATTAPAPQEPASSPTPSERPAAVEKPPPKRRSNTVPLILLTLVAGGLYWGLTQCGNLLGEMSAQRIANVAQQAPVRGSPVSAQDVIGTWQARVPVHGRDGLTDVRFTFRESGIFTSVYGPDLNGGSYRLTEDASGAQVLRLEYPDGTSDIRVGKLGPNTLAIDGLEFPRADEAVEAGGGGGAM